MDILFSTDIKYIEQRKKKNYAPCTQFETVFNTMKIHSRNFNNSLKVYISIQFL